MEKWCGKRRTQGLRVTTADAISRALIEQNKLNWCSPSSRLLKWSINPSTSLKCTVTDSGKLLSAGLFACLLLPAGQIYLVGKALIKRSGFSCWHNYVLQRAKQCLETNWERGLETAIKWYETVFHMDSWTSRTKPVDFENYSRGAGHYCS